jgi:Asp-tRNA(Asn)/Glu-tRNA(Gln) amidotransferase B subunit
MRINDLRTLIAVYDEYKDQVDRVNKTELNSLDRNSLINLLTGVTMRRLNGKASPQLIREIFKYEIMGYC